MPFTQNYLQTQSRDFPERNFEISLKNENIFRFFPESNVFTAGQLLVLNPRTEMIQTAVSKSARVLLLGGEPFGEKRFIWWNFVSSSKARIEKAKADWKAGVFARVPEETARIPLPADSRPVVACYP